MTRRRIAAFLLGLTAPGAALALEPPMIVAGGQLDPAFPNADVYIDTPAAPTLPPGRACALAQHYVELINAGQYLEVAGLFADDATFLEPMRPTLHGRAEIDNFYSKRIGALAPQVMGVSFFGNDGECMVELALQTVIAGQKRWALVSIDHFILGEDGKVKSMTAFARPPRE